MTSVRLSPELKTLRAGWTPQALPPSVQVDDMREPFQRCVLRRSGGRPLVFQGMLLVGKSVGAGDEASRRHAIRVYETYSRSFVVEVVLSAAGEGVPHSVVAEVETLQQAEAFLNAYDPASQAVLTLMVDDNAMDAFAVGSMADGLRTDAERLRRDFNTVRDALFAATCFEDNDTSRRVN